MNFTKTIRRVFHRMSGNVLPRVLLQPKAIRLRLRGKAVSRRLHVGCGNNRFEGWINADITPEAELIIFLERRLPFSDGSLSRIYSEHVLEHVPYEVGVGFLREAFRVLESGGVVRLAVPDLRELVEGYLQGDWRTRFDWTQWPDYAFLKTGAQMINVGFRWWGHQHLYDREELKRALEEAGFVDIVFPAFCESAFEDLRALETRLDSRLIADAIKR